MAVILWVFRMIPCERISSHKRRHRAHRDGQVLFCIFTYSHFRPINTWSHEIHWICHRTKHFCGGWPHRLMQQQMKTRRSGNVPRSNMAAPFTCFSLLMNVIHSVFENERIKTICYDTLVCVWGLFLRLRWGLDSCERTGSDAPRGEELYLYLKGFDGFTLKADGWKRDMR